MLGSPVGLAVDDEPDGEHVEHALERHLLLLHLLVDGEGRLGADFKLVDDALVVELLLQRLYELLHELFPVCLGALELVGYRSVLLRLGISEVDVLHLALDVVEAELVGEGNVEHLRLQDLPFP